MVCHVGIQVVVRKMPRETISGNQAVTLLHGRPRVSSFGGQPGGQGRSKTRADTLPVPEQDGCKKMSVAACT